LPWLVITTIVLPVLDYIHYFFYQTGNTLPGISFPEYWVLSIKKIAEFYTGWMDMSAYWKMTEKFYQRYMWFLSLLLFFFIVFALFHKIKSYLKIKTTSIKTTIGAQRMLSTTSIKTTIGAQRMLSTGKKNSNHVNSKSNVLKALFFISVIIIIFFSLIRFIIYPQFMAFGWFSLGNIIQFQFSKLVIYSGFFCMGIYAFSKKWFTGNFNFGKDWLWAISCFFLFGLNMLVLKNLTSSDVPLFGFKIAFCILYPLWSLSFLGFFVSWAYKRWNRPTRFNMNLAKNSFNMYLVHYIVPFILPLLLNSLNIPVLMKFGIVSIVTIFFSYVVSRFVLKPVSILIRNMLGQIH